MYIYYLSLGSNLGVPDKNLDIAIQKLQNEEMKVIKIGPYYYNHPLLPENYNENYYKIFCNTVIKIESKLTCHELLKATQKIEISMGRDVNHLYWSPRIIDIDIICCYLFDSINNIYNEIIVNDKDLIIPHKELFNRAFVLDPLSQIAPDLIINNKNVLTESKKQKLHQSVIMAIVNITDNSFSGDGLLMNNNISQSVYDKIKKLVDNKIGIIDIGAEATNKNAKVLTYKEEIERLQNAKIFDIIKSFKKEGICNGVKFSIDSYHYETVKFAIENGFDIINDVNGFKEERMWKILQDNKQINGVIVHSLFPNLSGNNSVLTSDIDIINEINNFNLSVEENAKKFCVDKERIIIDYGIGFGKKALQSMKIILNIDTINNRGFRVLIGHSKKSFMKLLNLNNSKNINNDNTNNNHKNGFITLGMSLALMKKGVDILRVHDAIELRDSIIGNNIF